MSNFSTLAESVKGLETGTRCFFLLFKLDLKLDDVCERVCTNALNCLG